MNFLDDEFGQVREHVVLVFLAAQDPGVDIADDGRLAEIEADHLGDVGINRLVVGHAGTDGVGDGDAAGAVGGEQAGDSQHGVGAEHQGIQEIVVDAAVDDIDALRALGGAHEDGFVTDEKILAFHQLDAHLLREEGVFEIGAVVSAGGEENDRGVGDAGGGDAAQIVEQHVGVVVDGGDAVAGEQLGEQAHHHLAVLEHVGDAGGDAQVVFEDAEFAGVVAHDVDAGDVGVDAAGHVDALHLGAVLGVAEHLFRRDDAGLENLLLVVDVVDEGVEGADSLLEASLEADPFFERQHTGDDVEGDEALGAFFLAVHGEGDAYPME